MTESTRRICLPHVFGQLSLSTCKGERNLPCEVHQDDDDDTHLPVNDYCEEEGDKSSTEEEVDVNGELQQNVRYTIVLYIHAHAYSLTPFLLFHSNDSPGLASNLITLTSQKQTLYLMRVFGQYEMPY